MVVEVEVEIKKVMLLDVDPENEGLVEVVTLVILAKQVKKVMIKVAKLVLLDVEEENLV